MRLAAHPWTGPHARRGGVLIEFTLVALVLYLLLAATIEFGRMIFSAQAVQSAADVAARELAKAPLPPTLTFEQALFRDPSALPPAHQQAVLDARRRVFDPSFLVIDLDDAGNADLDAVFAAAPLVNRMLRPLMIVDATDGGPRYLRYPGALRAVPAGDSPTPTGMTVRIPLLDEGGNLLPEVDWADVVEEVKDATGAGPFSLVADVADPSIRGMVAVRINYPYQAAALVSYPAPPTPPIDPDEPFPPNVGDPNPVLDGDGRIGPNAGSAGLGRLEAVGQQVRPYRKVVSAKSFARREVFAP